MDIGIIISTEKNQSGMIYKVFAEIRQKQHYDIGSNNAIKIAYEEENKDAIYKVYDVQPENIIDIFNEKLDLGKLEPEVIKLIN